VTDEAETQAVSAGRRLTRSPLFGIGLALLGALIITPDTPLIRLSRLEGWPLTALATVPMRAALLSFVILREATTRRTWQAIIMTMAGVLIVVLNGEGALAAPRGSVFLGGFLGVMTALCIAVVFVFTRRYPLTSVQLAVSLGTLSTGFSRVIGTDLQEMMAGSLWAVLVMCLLSLAPRYTAPTNVSLLMLL
jgi:drug/metabolite transporter (DMT)-like permease